MKNITYILLLFSLSVFGQRPNNFNDSTYFARSVRFQVPPYIIQGAGNGKVLTSDANGRATWQTFSDSGVTQQALNDSIARLDYTINTLQTSLNDTANVLRGLIPDISTYATITNLKDSTSLLRSLIPQTPTFSLSKNSAKDSIITIFNGVRSAVKDSTANLTNYVTNSSTSILTNKRITARVDSTTSSATPTINTDNIDTYKLTAQAVDITSFTTNLTGTPTDDQILHIVIIGTATRAITWGSKFESSTVALPTTTSGTTRLDVYFIWNTNTSKWRCGGVW